MAFTASFDRRGTVGEAILNLYQIAPSQRQTDGRVSLLLPLIAEWGQHTHGAISFVLQGSRPQTAAEGENQLHNAAQTWKLCADLLVNDVEPSLQRQLREIAVFYCEAEATGPTQDATRYAATRELCSHMLWTQLACSSSRRLDGVLQLVLSSGKPQNYGVMARSAFAPAIGGGLYVGKLVDGVQLMATC